MSCSLWFASGFRLAGFHSSYCDTLVTNLLMQHLLNWPWRDDCSYQALALVLLTPYSRKREIQEKLELPGLFQDPAWLIRNCKFSWKLISIYANINMWLMCCHRWRNWVAWKPIYLFVVGQKICLIAMLNKLMSLGSIFYWRKNRYIVGLLGWIDMGYVWYPHSRSDLKCFLFCMRLLGFNCLAWVARYFDRITSWIHHKEAGRLQQHGLLLLSVLLQ